MLLNWVFSHKKQKSTVFYFLFGSFSIAPPLFPLSLFFLSPSSPFQGPALSLNVSISSPSISSTVAPLPLSQVLPPFLSLLSSPFSFSSFSWLSLYLIFFVLLFTSDYLLEKTLRLNLIWKENSLSSLVCLAMILGQRLKTAFQVPKGS